MDAGGPYRDGKPLTDIIPPDRRRAKVFALVLGSMIAGVAVWQLAIYAAGALASPGTEDPISAPVTPGYAAGRIPSSTLHGPGGDVTLPPRVRSVVHVWLQGCRDCMPAFEAMRDDARLGPGSAAHLRAPVINVSYGVADPAWAASYGVGDNLVTDPGGAKVVKPLGIGTFTSLVVDPDGVIIHRDRPDRPGYADRMRAALEEESSPSDPPPQPPTRAGLDADAVQRVVAAHQREIKERCWQQPENAGASSARVNMSLVVGTDGVVTSASAGTGDGQTPLSACIVRETRRWRFPPPSGVTTVNIPFHFVRE